MIEKLGILWSPKFNYRKAAIFLSLICYLASISLVVCSCSTEYWVVSGILDENGLPIRDSGINSGLLSGMRKIDWGLGMRYMPFSVFDEIQSGVSFYNHVLWIFTLFFIALGILWIIIGVVTALMSSFVADEDSIVAGPIGIYLWSLLALLSLSGSCAIFYILFQTSLQKNLLSPEQIHAGYTTQGLVRLGYSFYIMLGAIVALYFPPLLIFLSSDRGTRTSPRKAMIDPTALLY
ncbi:hypothetical protein Q1695_001169 [Nippostrongylus brasiliensis]|nr:hypothetical protein Q1695_001169 [Nippostrongylus brasiliensis]